MILQVLEFLNKYRRYFVVISDSKHIFLYDQTFYRALASVVQTWPQVQFLKISTSTMVMVFVSKYENL